MKISARQVRAVLDEYTRYGAHLDCRIPPAAKGIIFMAPDVFLRQFELLPEQRDIVVHDLRHKIRSGSYYISSTEIVEALLGRLAANLIAD